MELDNKISLIEEEVDFGENIGKFNISQCSYELFNKKCLSINSQNDDNTGLRIHGGTTLAVLLLRNRIIQNLLFSCNPRVLELGAGVGVFGLLGTSLGNNCKNLTITDGNEIALNIAKLNYKKWTSYNNSLNLLSNVNFSVLPWGSIETINYVKNTCNDNNYYDIVLGCELIYFNTDFEELFSTVSTLLHENGLFLHVHFIRLVDQVNKINKILEKFNWITIEIPVESFVSNAELDCHQEWYRARCLISGPKNKLKEYLLSYSSWKLFTDDIDNI